MEKVLNSKKATWIIVGLCVAVAFLFINSGIDVTDSGYILNSYRFVFSNPKTIEFGFIFNSIIGNLIFRVFELFNIPSYIGFKIVASLTTLLCAYIVYITLKKYFNKNLILLGLLISLLFSRNFINILMYNHTTALFFVISVSFLIRGLLEDKLYYIFFSSFIIGINTFVRIPNIVEAIIGLGIIYLGVLEKNMKRTLNRIFVFFFGLCFALGLSLLVINQLFGMELIINSVTKLSTIAQSSGDGHTINEMIKNNLLQGIGGIKYILSFQIVVLILYLLTKKIDLTAKIIKLLYAIAIIIPIFYFSGIIFGFNKINIIELIYLKTYHILIPITILVAFIGIYTLGTSLWFRKENNLQKNLICFIVSLMMLAVPIGSNNYFYSFLHDIYFQMALGTAIIGEFILRKISNGKYENIILLEKVIATSFLVFTILMPIILGWNYNYRDKARTYEANVDHKELNGMYTTKERAKVINELLKNVPNNIKEGSKLISHGDIPIFNYLLEMPPFFKGSNGWSGLSSVSVETLEETMKESTIKKELPLIIISKLETENIYWPNKTKIRNKKDLDTDEKLKALYNYIISNGYKKVFENECFEMYFF